MLINQLRIFLLMPMFCDLQLLEIDKIDEKLCNFCGKTATTF